MLTESGSVIAKSVVNEQTQRKFTKKLYIASIVCLIVGAVGLAAYLAISIGLFALIGFESQYIEIMLVFSAPFAFGLIFLLTLKKQYKNAALAGERVITYEFFADDLVIREYCDGSQLAMSRANYSQIVKAVEKPEYIYIYFIKTALCPVDITALSQAELNAVRRVLRLPVPQNSGECATLPQMQQSDYQEKPKD